MPPTVPATAGGREQLVRQLHDDVGASLLSLIYRADSQCNAVIARCALQDLRDTLRRIDQQECALLDVLADWRSQSEQQTDSVHCELSWWQPHALHNEQLSARSVISIGTVFRRMVALLIAHPVTQVRVEMSYELPILAIMMSRHAQSGHGAGDSIAQQQVALIRRVERLGGELIFEGSLSTECRVLCRIPLRL